MGGRGRRIRGEETEGRRGDCQEVFLPLPFPPKGAARRSRRARVSESDKAKRAEENIGLK